MINEIQITCPIHNLPICQVDIAPNINKGERALCSECSSIKPLGIIKAKKLVEKNQINISENNQKINKLIKDEMKMLKNIQEKLQNKYQLLQQQLQQQDQNTQYSNLNSLESVQNLGEQISKQNDQFFDEQEQLKLQNIINNIVSDLQETIINIQQLINPIIKFEQIYKFHDNYSKNIICANLLNHQIYCDQENEIAIFNCSQNGAQFQNSLNGHKQEVICLQMTDDGQKLISSSLDETIIIWKQNEQKEWQIQQYLNLNSEIVSTLFIHSNTVFFSGSRNNQIRIWIEQNNQSFNCNQTVSEHFQNITCFSFINNILASGSDDKQIILWNYQDNLLNCQLKMQGIHNQEIYSVQLVDSSHLISASTQIKLWSFDLKNNQYLLLDQVDIEQWCSQIKYIPQYQLLISEEYENGIKIRKIKNGKFCDHQQFKGNYQNLCMSKDYTEFFVKNGNNQIECYKCYYAQN